MILGNGGKRYRKASDLLTSSQTLATVPQLLCFRVKTALVIGGRDESDDYNGLNYFLARGSSNLVAQTPGDLLINQDIGGGR